MPRIAIAGFQHETNTFGTTRATFHEFEIADSWPGLLEGEAVLSGTAGFNLPIAGFAEAASAVPGIELIPILWCAAEPSGHVTDETFERIAGMILDGIAAAGSLDGVYLDLHGAMVTESHEDGEGALLARIRAAVGPDLPVVASLDLHANVSAAMVEAASALAIFRTYPHLDMAATGARCLPLMLDLIAGRGFAKAFRQADFLIPAASQFTGAEPARGLYGLLDHPGRGVVSSDIAMGFTAADIADAGVSVVAYAETAVEAEAEAARLLDAIHAAEPAFRSDLPDAAAAVARAMARAGDGAGGPVVIADLQDNPGAGASSDTTGMLAALVAAGADGAVLGLMHDADMAALAHAAGEGAVIEGALGGKAGTPDVAPFPGRFRVERLGDGNCAYTGEMYGGGIAVLGPTAVLAVEGRDCDVRVVVTTARIQCLDRALFTHIGIDPAAERIVCVKSTAHFRADFDPIAAETIVAAAPGLYPCDPAKTPYRRLRPGVRLSPNGPVFRGAAAGAAV